MKKHLEWYSRLDEELQQKFFQKRCESLSAEDALAYDSSTISTYSENQNEARYGFNKAPMRYSPAGYISIYLEDLSTFFTTFGVLLWIYFWKSGKNVILLFWNLSPTLLPTLLPMRCNMLVGNKTKGDNR